MGDSVDDVVVGADASAMAFVDARFHPSDTTFAVVDRRQPPGAGRRAGTGTTPTLVWRYTNRPAATG